MWQGLRLGFVAETGSYATIDALSTVLLLFASFPCFIYFLPLRSSCGTCLSMYLSLLRLASSMHCMQHSYVPLESTYVFLHFIFNFLSSVVLSHFRIVCVSFVSYNINSKGRMSTSPPGTCHFGFSYIWDWRDCHFRPPDTLGTRGTQSFQAPTYPGDSRPPGTSHFGFSYPWDWRDSVPSGPQAP